MTSNQISEIINTAIESIDKSSFGPFYISNPDNLSQKNISPVNWQIFTIVLSSLLSKME